MGTTTWSPVEHRSDLIRQLLGSGRTSVAEVEDADLRAQLDAEFPTFEELLAALHAHWSALLEANVDVALDEEDPGYAMGIAWEATVLHSPALRRILDRHAENPVLQSLTDRERARLGRLTGLGTGEVVQAVQRFAAG